MKTASFCFILRMNQSYQKSSFVVHTPRFDVAIWIITVVIDISLARFWINFTREKTTKKKEERKLQKKKGKIFPLLYSFKKKCKKM